MEVCQSSFARNYLPDFIYLYLCISFKTLSSLALTNARLLALPNVETHLIFKVVLFIKA